MVVFIHVRTLPLLLTRVMHTVMNMYQIFHAPQRYKRKWLANGWGLRSRQQQLGHVGPPSTGPQFFKRIMINNYLLKTKAPVLYCFCFVILRVKKDSVGSKDIPTIDPPMTHQPQNSNNPFFFGKKSSRIDQHNEMIFFNILIS